MASISGLLVTLNQPSGFWVSILNAFKGANGTYILAVILIALIVRVVFALVDILNKKVTMKTNSINAKMKPELDAIKQKYGHDQALMQQKTNEVYKKYQFNMVGSCLPMLITMVLQFTVFLTLWNSLQSVSNFNIAEKYQNMKNIYANVINLNADNDPKKTSFQEFITDADVIMEAEIDFEKNILNVTVTKGEEIKNFDFDYVNNWTNEEIFEILEKYVKQPVPETPENPEGKQQEEIQTNAQEPSFEETALNTKIKNFAEKVAEDFYKQTQEGFLWIKNIYKSESPTSPMFTESEIKTYLSKYYTKDEIEAEKLNDFEGKIFKNVVAGIDVQSMGNNGYYILTIVAVLSSVLSLWLSNFLMRSKTQPAQKQSWMMYVIMPIIIGIFTFMYTSLFAIYLIVGQLVMMLLTPLTTFIVKKWTEHDINKKKEKNVIEVDYRRK